MLLGGLNKSGLIFMEISCFLQNYRYNKFSLEVLKVIQSVLSENVSH